MTVKELKHILFDIQKYIYDEDRVDAIEFCPEDDPDYNSYTACRVHKDTGGNVIIESDAKSRSELNVSQISQELSAFDKDADVFFHLLENGHLRVFEPMDHWEVMEDEKDWAIDFYINEV